MDKINLKDVDPGRRNRINAGKYDVLSQAIFQQNYGNIHFRSSLMPMAEIESHT